MLDRVSRLVYSTANERDGSRQDPGGEAMAREDELAARNGGHEARLSRASVARLSLYLRRLEGLLRDGHPHVSSGQLADTLGVTDTQVRKDLAPLGGLGHPGVGYDTADLITVIRRRLGLDRTWLAALVGVGNLARALLRYQGFVERGFRIVALFDIDATKIGQTVDGLTIQPNEQLGEVVRQLGVELAVLTVPVEAAQRVAETIAAAGVKGILNFTPAVLRVPERVSVVNVDLTVQLEQLAFLVQLGGGS